MSDDLMQSMLENLTKSEGRAPAMSELLAQMGETDPKMALVAKYFAQREAVAFASSPAETETAAARREAIDKLHRLVDRMYAELEALRERNQSLATALGSCPACWGEDPGCEACGGEGFPGSSVPDKVLFAHYVGPVIELLRSCGHRAAKPPPTGPPAPDFKPGTNPNNNNNNHH